MSVFRFLLSRFTCKDGMLEVGITSMPMIVGFVPAALFFIGSVIAAMFSLWWGATGYAAAIYVALIVILVSCACVRAPADPMGARRIILSEAEERLFKKHYAFFRFPFGTQNLAHFINYARMFGIVWILIGLWKGLYWQASSLTVFYLISGHIMMWLYPTAHYVAITQKGHEVGARAMAQIEHILRNRDVLGF